MTEATNEPVSTAGQVHPWVAGGQPMVRFGIVGGPAESWSALRDFVQMVEDLGFDSYWRPDHPMLLPDCWATLAALAEATQRIRLGSLVTCVSYRNPVVLARLVADVDRISGGRIVLGLGAGDIEAEYRAMGLEFPSLHARQAALAEALEILIPLLRGEVVTYRGEHMRVEGVALRPSPMQHPYVPVLVGGGGPQTTLRLAAQYADASSIGAGAWGGSAATDAIVRQKYAALDVQCSAAGRPPAAVLRSFHCVPVLLADNPSALATKRERLPPELQAAADSSGLIGTPEQALARIRPLVAAGCQYITLAVLDPDTLRLLAERVVPEVNDAQ